MNKLKKTVLYRAVAIVSTFGITYLLTRNLILPTLLTAIHEIVHTGLYYLFEVLSEKY